MNKNKYEYQLTNISKYLQHEQKLENSKREPKHTFKIPSLPV